MRGVPGAALFLAAAVLVPGPLDAQGSSDSYVLTAPSGERLSLSRDRVRDMLDRTRRLRQILEEDPDVLYYVGSAPFVEPEDPSPAYPWHAVRVQNDSVARVAVPGNYREARRAYYNYAVKKMAEIRESPPPASCDEAVRREAEVVSAWVDGWIVARTLYGGPAFDPLDALAFAREAGHLPAMIVDLGDTAVGGCLDRWKRENADALAAYRAWRAEVFPPAPADPAPEEANPPADTATDSAHPTP